MRTPIHKLVARRIIVATGFILLLGLGHRVLAYCVPTHQEMTRYAVEKSVNFRNFLKDMGILGRHYDRRHLTTAERTFAGGPERIRFTGHTTAGTVVQAGAAMEDSAMRFENHFQDPAHAHRGLHHPLGRRPSAKVWGYRHFANRFDWLDILGGRSTLTGPSQGILDRALASGNRGQRQSSLEDLYFGLGYQVHLVQDLAQPAHTRDDWHPTACFAPTAPTPGFGAFWISPTGGSMLESYAHLNFRSGLFTIRSPLRRFVAAAQPEYFSQYDQYFDDTATYSNSNFFSDGTIFSSSYPSPNRNNTWETVPIIGPTPAGVLTYRPGVVTSRTVTLNDRPAGPRPARLAVKQRTTLLGASGSSYRIDTLSAGDNALALVPMAVSRSAGMLNHFFRGRILVLPDPNDRDRLIIRNISDLSTVNNPSDLHFLPGGAFHIMYEGPNGVRHPLRFPYNRFWPDTGPMVIFPGVRPGAIRVGDQGRTLSGYRGIRDELDHARATYGSPGRLIVVYKGAIGQEAGFAATTLCLPENVSILLAFDRSGSMQGSLQTAKDAALSLIDVLQLGRNNRVAVMSFGGGVRVDQPYTNNLNQAKAAINGLRANGGTPLYQAIVQGANLAAIEGQNRNSYFILFTDGDNTGVGTTKQQAIQSIKKSRTPTIKEVFLVSVPNHSTDLESIATAADREYVHISSFSGVIAEFQNILRQICPHGF